MKRWLAILFCFSTYLAPAQYSLNWEEVYNIPQVDSGAPDDEYLIDFMIQDSNIYSVGYTFAIDSVIGTWHYGAPFYFNLNSSNGDSVRIIDYRHTCYWGAFWGGFEIVDSNIYMFGNNFFYNGNDTVRQMVIKTDLLGNQENCLVYNQDYLLSDGQDIISIDESSLFLLTQKRNDLPTYEDDISLTKIDTNGNTIWRKEWTDSAYAERPQKIIKTHRNTFYILSNVYGEGNDTGNYSGADIEVREIDEDGNVLNIEVLGVDGTKEWITDAHITPDEGLIITGVYGTSGLTSERGYLVKYNANFNKEWEYTLEDGIGNDRTYYGEIALLEDSSFVVVGNHTYERNGRIQQFDLDGNILWDTLINSTVMVFNYFNLIEASDSSIFISGSYEDGNFFPFRKDMYFARWDGFAPPYHIEGHLCDFAPNANFSYSISNGEIQFTDGSTSNSDANPITSWSWSFGDTIANTATNYNPEVNDTITLVVENAVGCRDTVQKVILMDGVGELAYNAFIVYPNPFNETFTLKWNPNWRATYEGSHLRILNLMGQLVHQQEILRLPSGLLQNDVVIDGSELQKGIYILEVQGIGRVKVVKE